MDTLEELEQRKKELLLRQEIAQLERQEKKVLLLAKTGKWSWWWVAPAFTTGIVFLMAMLENGKLMLLPVILLLLVPTVLKLLSIK